MPPYPARNIRLSAIVPRMNDHEKIWNRKNWFAMAGINRRTTATSAAAG